MNKVEDPSKVLTDEEKMHREESIERLQHWYKLTGNPLFAWEATMYCLDIEHPRQIPEWCLQYIRKTACNLFLLSRSADFSLQIPVGGQISEKQAFGLVNKALGISRRGSTNAFKRLAKDRNDCRDALAELDYGPGVVEQRRTARNVEPERQRRINRRGLKLLRVPRGKASA